MLYSWFICVIFFSLLVSCLFFFGYKNQCERYLSLSQIHAKFQKWKLIYSCAHTLLWKSAMLFFLHFSYVFFLYRLKTKNKMWLFSHFYCMYFFSPLFYFFSFHFFLLILWSNDFYSFVQCFFYGDATATCVGGECSFWIWHRCLCGYLI